jgi:hypothetical protein
MKKQLSFMFGVLLSLTVFAANFTYAGGRGSTEARVEDDSCESGVARNCQGDGNLCSRTIGFDCEPYSGPQQ